MTTDTLDEAPAKVDPKDLPPKAPKPEPAAAVDVDDLDPDRVDDVDDQADVETVEDNDPTPAPVETPPEPEPAAAVDGQTNPQLTVEWRIVDGLDDRPDVGLGDALVGVAVAVIGLGEALSTLRDAGHLHELRGVLDDLGL